MAKDSPLTIVREVAEMKTGVPSALPPYIEVCVFCGSSAAHMGDCLKLRAQVVLRKARQD